jgi:hypothetical protein
MSTTEKRTVKIGIGTLSKPMTKEHAYRFGVRNMPADLKRAGFGCTVFASDAETHGGLWFRVAYGRTVSGGAA